jgi:beta-N-acetylhexosaminidase
MLDIHGKTLTSEDKDLLQQAHVGGVILFSRNISEPEQVLELTSAIRAQRPEILLAVDQEGGRVQRLREGFTRLPPMLMFGHQWRKQPEHTVRLAHDCGWLMASEVLAAGFDFSFAPVLDLYTGLSEVIGNRAFSEDKEVSRPILTWRCPLIIGRCNKFATRTCCRLRAACRCWMR